MKIRLAIVLALALSLDIIPTLRAQDPGSTQTITAAIPANGYSCGRQSYPLYCFGVSIDGGSSFWLDSYYNSASAEGFIQFYNVGNLGYAQITGTAAYKNGLGQVVQETVNFAGDTSDNVPFTGTATFTFSYVKCTAKYCGYVTMMQSGSMTITYN